MYLLPLLPFFRFCVSCFAAPIASICRSKEISLEKEAEVNLSKNDQLTQPKSNALSIISHILTRRARILLREKESVHFAIYFRFCFGRIVQNRQKLLCNRLKNSENDFTQESRFYLLGYRLFSWNSRSLSGNVRRPWISYWKNRSVLIKELSRLRIQLEKWKIKIESSPSLSSPRNLSFASNIRIRGDSEASHKKRVPPCIANQGRCVGLFPSITSWLGLKFPNGNFNSSSDRRLLEYFYANQEWLI